MIRHMEDMDCSKEEEFYSEEEEFYSEFYSKEESRVRAPLEAGKLPKRGTGACPSFVSCQLVEEELQSVQFREQWQRRDGCNQTSPF